MLSDSARLAPSFSSRPGHLASDQRQRRQGKRAKDIDRGRLRERRQQVTERQVGARGESERQEEETRGGGGEG